MGDAGAERQITAVAGKLDAQVTNLRTDLFARYNKTEGDLFFEANELRIDANDQLKRVGWVGLCVSALSRNYSPELGIATVSDPVAS